MTSFDWSVAVGVLTTALAVILPWMLMVHARLAVAVSKLSDLDKRVGGLAERLEALCELEHQRQLECTRCQARLQTLEDHMAEADLE